MDDHSSKKKTKSPPTRNNSLISKEFECDDKIGLFASDAQLNSDRSEIINEITNLNLADCFKS